MKKSLLLLFAFITMISIVLAGCSSDNTGGSNDNANNGNNGNDSGGGGDAQDTLIYGRGADATRLDPATVTDGESLKVTQQIMETLIKFTPGTTELEEGLATDWEQKDDGKTYVFELREGVQFHDGTDFNADAVVYNFERWQDENNEDNIAYYPSMFGGFGDESVINEVKAVDDYTVEFHLETAFAPFLKNLAMVPFAIASPDALKEKGDEFENHPVGTGPFEFDQWEKNSKIVLKKNDNYWDESKPKLERVIFQVIPDNSSRVNALKSGEIDLMDGTNPSDVEAIKSNDDLDIWNRPPLNVGYFGFNVEEEPFDNKKVRQALSHAVDKESLVEAFYAGNGETAKNPMPPTINGFNEEIEPYEFDLDKAKEKLADAGYEDGFEMELWTMTNPRPYLPQPQKIAEAIQSSFGKIGVDASIQTMEWSTYLEKVEDGEAPAFFLGWTGDNGHPDNFLYTLLDEDSIGSNNYSRYANSDVHDLLTDAQVEPDEDKRAELYKEAQEIIHEDAPWIPLVYAEEPLAGTKKLQDYQPNPTGTEAFDVVHFE